MIQLTLKFERPTKNTVRFVEVDENGDPSKDPVLGSGFIYVNKEAHEGQLGSAAEISVIVEPVKGAKEIPSDG